MPSRRAFLCSFPSVGLSNGRFAERGRPELVRSDNGPRVYLAADDRLAERSAGHIRPGKPLQNRHVVNFNGRLRGEGLSASWFHTLGDVLPTTDTP